jgi:hypothetical protein
MLLEGELIVKTVIVPAYNEGAVIGRLLKQIVPWARSEGAEVLVVANGCDDNTVEVANSFGPPVRTLTTPGASKQAALEIGNQEASGFPRFYIDADVELDESGMEALSRALDEPGVLAAAPALVMDVHDSALLVRWFTDIWSRLPAVQGGLWGRGVFAVTDNGYQRLAALPRLMADDLAASLAFASGERAIVHEAQARVHGPRTVGDLLRRRVRVTTGVCQLEQASGVPKSVDRTSWRQLLAIVKREPRLMPQLMTFLTIVLVTRILSQVSMKRHGYSVRWHRDESSRTHGALAEDCCAER